MLHLYAHICTHDDDEMRWASVVAEKRERRPACAYKSDILEYFSSRKTLSSAAAAAAALAGTRSYRRQVVAKMHINLNSSSRRDDAYDEAERTLTSQLAACCRRRLRRRLRCRRRKSDKCITTVLCVWQQPCGATSQMFRHTHTRAAKRPRMQC